MSQILPVWHGKTPTANRPRNPRAAETVKKPAATPSHVDHPINRLSPTAKSAKNARRGTLEGTAFTRKLIVHVCLTACVSLSSLRSLWLTCSVLSSEQNCSAKVKQLDKRAHSGPCSQSRTRNTVENRNHPQPNVWYARRFGCGSLCHVVVGSSCALRCLHHRATTNKAQGGAG